MFKFIVIVTVCSSVYGGVETREVGYNPLIRTISYQPYPGDRVLPETLSQIKYTAVVENNTLYENKTDSKQHSKDEDPHEKADRHKSDDGHELDVEEDFPPRFKHPTKLFRMDMKPVGSSITLRCAAKGKPTPNITWYKNRSTPIVRTFFQPQYGKWSMSMDELTKADKGNYTCVVCNQLGCIEHTVVLLIQERYESKPYIKEGYPGNITALVNETVTFDCPPVSDLEPYVYWTRLHNYSTKDAEVGISDVPFFEQTIESDNPDDKPEQLTIYNVTKNDEGWYTCVAVNSLGNSMAKGFLTVLEFTDAATSNISQTNITTVVNKQQPTVSESRSPTTVNIAWVCGAVMSVALMIAVVTGTVCVYKRSRNNRTEQRLPRLPTRVPDNFYLNMLFRDQCQREIEARELAERRAREEHIYEEIKDPEYDYAVEPGEEPDYEEIENVSPRARAELNSTEI